MKSPEARGGQTDLPPTEPESNVANFPDGHILTENELDELEEAARHEDEDNEMIEPPEQEQKYAHYVLENGIRLLLETGRDLKSYIDAMQTLQQLGSEGEKTKEAILSDIAWAIHSRQDETAALMWALDRSGLVVKPNESSESENMS